jgi:hypothetical protein
MATNQAQAKSWRVWSVNKNGNSVHARYWLLLGKIDKILGQYLRVDMSFLLTLGVVQATAEGGRRREREGKREGEREGERESDLSFLLTPWAVQARRNDDTTDKHEAGVYNQVQTEVRVGTTMQTILRPDGTPEHVHRKGSVWGVGGCTSARGRS